MDVICIYRCVADACGCDMGGDCECLCTALAAYAHECAIKGVPIKWRSQEICRNNSVSLFNNFRPIKPPEGIVLRFVFDTVIAAVMHKIAK